MNPAIPTPLWSVTVERLEPRCMLNADVSGPSIATDNAISFHGAVFFAASEAATGHELWRSDGTAGGTGLLKDIAVGARDSNPSDLNIVGDSLMFFAGDQQDHLGLWKSDGTASGTVRVKDLSAISNDQNIYTAAVAIPTP